MTAKLDALLRRAQHKCIYTKLIACIMLVKELEKVCLANNANYKNWEYNEQMMKSTKNGDALYMHCLPADISGVSCKEGEVNGDVFEKYRIRTYLEAGYKPYIIAAMMFATRFENPSQVLKQLMERNRIRVGV